MGTESEPEGEKKVRLTATELADLENYMWQSAKQYHQVKWSTDANANEWQSVEGPLTPVFDFVSGASGANVPASPVEPVKLQSAEQIGYRLYSGGSFFMAMPEPASCTPGHVYGYCASGWGKMSFQVYRLFGNGKFKQVLSDFNSEREARFVVNALIAGEPPTEAKQAAQYPGCSDPTCLACHGALFVYKGEGSPLPTVPVRQDYTITAKLGSSGYMWPPDYPYAVEAPADVSEDEVEDEDENNEGEHYTGQVGEDKSPTETFNLWELPKLSLHHEAADFYILEFLSGVHEYAPATKLLKERTARLANAFSRYAVMAIGGEYRHILRFVPWSDLTPEQRRIYPDPKLKDGQHRRMPRCFAWVEWKRIFDEQGVAAVEAIAAAFREHEWEGGFGGDSWARIAETVARYLNGKIPPKVFVDNLWSRQHNSGRVFDKAPGRFLGLEDLAVVLQYQRVGEVKGLCHYAGARVLKLYTEWEAKHAEGQQEAVAIGV